MGVLSKGTTFADGTQVTSTNLNNLVDAAVFTSSAVDDATTQLSGGKIVVKTIQTGNIATNAVTTAKIVDANVTEAKLATDSVSTVKIQDDAITNAKIADNSIEQAQMADNSVGTAEIIDANITAAKLDGAQTGSAPIYGIRAWVNFDGTSTTSVAGTYSRTVSSNTATVTIPSHGLLTGHHVYLDFASGTADGIYSVTKVDDNSFTITTAETTAQSSVAVDFDRVSITASGNISNACRIGVGRYMVNMTVALPSANYAFVGAAEDSLDTDLSDLNVGSPFNGIRTNQSLYVTVANSGNVAVDSPSVNVAFIA